MRVSFAMNMPTFEFTDIIMIFRFNVRIRAAATQRGCMADFIYAFEFAQYL